MDKGQVLRQDSCTVAPQLVYEFELACDGAGELQAALRQMPDWRQVEVPAPHRVKALYAGEQGEPLALQLRKLAAEHLLTQVQRSRVTLEQTVIELMNEHEK